MSTEKYTMAYRKTVETAACANSPEDKKTTGRVRGEYTGGKKPSRTSPASPYPTKRRQSSPENAEKKTSPRGEYEPQRSDSRQRVVPTETDTAPQHIDERQQTDDPDGNDELAILSGIKPVLELLEREPERIDTVLLRKGHRSKDTDRILDLCRAAKVRFNLTDAQGLERLCPAGHQGVVARLFEAGFEEFSTLLEKAMEAPLPLILVLDQVQDPGNAGTLARTLYAMGGAGLVIPRHNGAYLGAGARRAAAGALERLPVAKVMNLSRALDEARDAGFQIYGAATEEGSIDVFTTPLHTPALLVLGNEDHGIRPQVAKRCHQMIHIPMLRDFDSLNVAQAGGILIGCFARQHLEKR